MIGQVKEDILCRFGELGVVVDQGQLSFCPTLLRASEFLTAAKDFTYINLEQEEKRIELSSGSLGFTYCQIPVIYSVADEASIEVIQNDATRTVIKGTALSKSISQSIFQRKGEVLQVNVAVAKTTLR